MEEVVRAPGRPHACPRCGRPVIYRGRGRRPVWCSSTCRVEASIERKGNRVVGVQPQVIMIEGSREAHEREVRERIEREMPDRIALSRVAASPALLEQLAIELQGANASHADEPWDMVARQLVRAAEQLRPGIAAAETQRHKRLVGEWVRLLSELASLLRTSQLYDRDLPKIDEPMNDLASAYLKRQARHR